MNQLATRTTAVFAAAMIAMIILGFAAVMTVSAQTEPERPTDLVATAVDHDTVSLTWNHPDPDSVDHYQVFSRTVGASTGLIQVGTATTTSFEHDGLEPESTYIYRVKPVNSAGEEGQRSARAEATTPAEETPAPEPDPTPVPDPTPAQPQPSDDKDQGNIARSSHNVLVSNTGQASNGTTITGNNGGTQTKHAQKFTTGSNPTGYTLDDVRLYIGAYGTNAAPIITINSGTGNNPGTVIYTLDNPGTFTSDTVNSFTATSGTTLDADTSYFVVMENTSTGGGGNQRYHVGTTLSNAEDSSGLSDWDIDNDGRTGAPNWGPTSSGVGYRIQVRGTANASNDATLSNLVLQDASDDSVLTLDPTFEAATLEYVATVGRAVGEITIIPTPNDTDADYEIKDGDGTALTDADTTQDEFQVSIARGLNAIQIEVTAEDDTTTQTYTVTVTRPRILVSSTGQTSGGSATTGNNSGSQHRHAQKFTTGSNPAGYTLDEVRIHLGTNGTAAAPVITVNSGSGNNPGAVLYTMTNPANITDAATNTFTAPSRATLEADTSYFVVMENSNTNDDPNALYQVGLTTSDGEDSSGLSDWDIHDTGRTGTPGWSATSGNVSFRIQVRGTVDLDPNATTLPELSFQSINNSVIEDTGTGESRVLILLSTASTNTVTVDYATSDITAETGSDYTETSGTFTFAAVETAKIITIPLFDDDIYETNERLRITLSNPTGATIADPLGQVTIIDDESPPTASIANVSVGEGAGTMTLTLNLSHESSRSTSYRTQTSYIGGTATQGADYENFLSGGEAFITVPAGDTQASLEITITDDTDPESSETITIRWDNNLPGGDATPSVINFTGTITDNDSETNPVTTLVRNTTETSNSSSNGTHAQSFQTGTNATGYTITEVRLRLGEYVPTNDQTVVKIRENHGSEPGNVVAALTNPSSLLPEALNTFTAPAGTTLQPNETYWIVVNDGLTITNTWQYAFASGNDETGETGWEIGNDRLRRTSGTNWSTSNSSLIMAIKGQINYPNLSIIDASATEGDDIVFTVNLSGTSADDVTFDYATSRSGDNSEDDDFTATSGSGTITAGSTYTTITVPTHDDGHNDTSSRYEGDETFTVTINNPTLAGISQATAKGTILDDERLPTVKFTSIDRIVTEEAGHITDFLTFDVVPPGEHTAYISFTFSGTATEGQDYNIQNTTLTVNANINSITTNIIMVNDNVAELDETAIITVVAASANIQVDPEFSTRTLTIQDDDEHPTLSFTSETYNVNENAGHAVLTVNKTGDSSFPVHVDYETVSRNLAIAGDDYVATSGTLTFQPEEFSKTISVPIIDNNIYRAFGQRFNVELIYSSQSNDQNVPSVGIDTAVVIIINDEPVPTASMANVTANERAGTMTLTLKLSHPSSQDISYRTPDNSEYRGGTATFEDDYEIQYYEIQQDVTNNATITVPAGQLTKSFDITLIDDDLEEPDETVELVWLKVSSSQATPDEFTFTGTITDPPICDALGNLENAMIVKNLTGEITQPGQSKFHRIKLDPYRSYMIEAIGHNGQDMLGVEEHPNLTLFNPDIPAIWNAKATSRWITYGDRNDGDQAKNVIRRFLDSDYRTYKVEVNAGNNGTGTYQLKIRVNNICRLDENDNAHYQWAGGPLGYPKSSDLPAGTGGRQVLLTGTDWGNNNVTRPEMHHVLGDNWNSDRDEDWIGVDLEDGELYTVRLRTKNSLPERLQATGLKILGIRDENGNEISGTTSAGAAGKKVFVTDWTAPSTGRFHIAVGSEGNDRTGIYWLSIIKDATN